MSAGEYEITASYKIYTGYEDPSSIEEQSVNIYPNPLSGGLLSIDLLGFNAHSSIDVKITNLLGQTVYSNTINNADHIEIDASGLSKNAFYLVTVKSGQSIITSKLIIE